jgi:hypothetical protein
MEKRQWLSLIGSVILCMGVFAPVMTMPALGKISYFLGGNGDGTIIIALALLSFLLTLQKKYRGLWYTGICATAVTTYSFLILRHDLSKLSSETQQAAHLSWGWAVLIIGAGLVMTSAAIKEESFRRASASKQ